MHAINYIRLGNRLKRGIVLPLLLLAHTLGAQPLDKEVKLPGGTMTYEKIFNLVEQQSDVWFGYAIQELDVTQSVSIPSGTFPVHGLLDWLFGESDYKCIVSGNHILITRKSVAAPQSVEPETFTPAVYKPYETKLPSVALKTNLLYDMTTTINLGVEIGLAPRWTLDVPFNFNAWEFGNDMRLRHWGLQPEGRYWFCQRFDGWFVGVHAHYAQFNVGSLPDWSFVSHNMRQNRYEGDLYGAGASVGYSWLMKKRWSMEFALGGGYAHIAYDKYPCAECGTSKGRKTKDYFGPTKAAVSLVFMIK